jgi:hypothetical protein
VVLRFLGFEAASSTGAAGGRSCVPAASSTGAALASITPSACWVVRLSQLTSARIGVASTWTTSPLTKPARTQSATTRWKMRLKRCAPHRWRMRVKLLWPGNVSSRRYPANQCNAKSVCARRSRARSWTTPSTNPANISRNADSGSMPGRPFSWQ